MESDASSSTLTSSTGEYFPLNTILHLLAIKYPKFVLDLNGHISTPKHQKFVSECKNVKSKIRLFWTLSDKKITFWAITPVLVGIFQICLHIWKLEKKCNRKCANRFFVCSRESGQNRTRRSKSWITIFQQPKLLKIGPPGDPLVINFWNFFLLKTCKR